MIYQRDGFAELHRQKRQLKMSMTPQESLQEGLRRCNITTNTSELDPRLGSVYFADETNFYIRVRTTRVLQRRLRFLPNAHVHVTMEELTRKRWRVSYHVTDEVPASHVPEGRCFTHSEQRTCILRPANGVMVMEDACAVE